MERNVLELEHIHKEYPGVVALDNVSLSLQKGEVHALLGENGAGKSTLIKVVSGAITPDSGTIRIDGQPYAHMSPTLSMKLGVQVIYQEFNLIESLSAAENICLGEKYGRTVNYKKMNQVAEHIFRQFQIPINPETLVRDLSTSQQQIVEIAKAISKNVNILIMDEPSAPLTVSEVDQLFTIVKHLKAAGVTIVYISHRMDEIFEISDRVSVLRDGAYIATKNTCDTNRQELIKLMVGRELNENFPQRESPAEEPVLELKNVTGNGTRDISFRVRKGEILGLGGLVGAGRTELAKVLFGAAKLESGSIFVDGKPVQIRSPKQAMRHGIGLIPEDRKTEGCFLEQDIQWNISLPSIRNISGRLFVNQKKERNQAVSYGQILKIKTPSLEQRVKNLSGGNQQKVALAKTLAANSKIIIFDEPTRGIDVGAKQEIYHLMNQLTGEGKGIIMISSDMEELLGMSDRIVVLCEGQLSGVVEKKAFSQEQILELASHNGQNRKSNRKVQ